MFRDFDKHSTIHNETGLGEKYINNIRRETTYEGRTWARTNKNGGSAARTEKIQVHLSKMGAIDKTMATKDSVQRSYRGSVGNVGHRYDNICKSVIVRTQIFHVLSTAYQEDEVKVR
jgi:hypothetical protein